MKKLLILLLILALAATSASAEMVAVGGQSSTAYAPIPWDAKVSPNVPNPDCYSEDNMSYHDDSIDVRITTFNADNGTLVYAMYITLTDISQFRVGTQATREPYQQTAYVWKMTERFNAVCGINDDYFGYHSAGIVYRNGVQIRMKPSIKRDELIVDDNGDFHIITFTTQEKWDAYDGTVLHAFCFGPGLVVDGEINEDLTQTKLNVGINNKTQRIAIGQIGHLQYLVLATDGPENKDGSGLTLMEMAKLCYDQGMINAYNLDGGSSSSLVLNNKKINGVGSKKRAVGGCIWFATLVPNEQ